MKRVSVKPSDEMTMFWCMSHCTPSLSTKLPLIKQVAYSPQSDVHETLVRGPGACNDVIVFL